MVQAVIQTTVTGLQGNPISTTAPATNQALTWNGSAWAPAGPFMPLAGGIFTGPVTIPAGSNIVGVTNGANPAAGQVGEFITNTTSNVGIASQNWMSITSIALTPGDWDIWGNYTLVGTGGDFGIIAGGLSLGANASPGYPASSLAFTSAIVQNCVLPVPTIRIITASTATLYLNCYCSFTVGTATANAEIDARRRR